MKKHFVLTLKLIKQEFFVYNGVRCCGGKANALAGEETPMSRYLQAKILAVGPITLAEYMKEVLTNPLMGYYMHGNVIGGRGDFITSPEVSQMFGEMVGVWLYSEWQKIGAPQPLQLVELGPGRGSLAEDILRVFTQLGVWKEISLHLVEVSPLLSELQAARLCPGPGEAVRSEAPHYRAATTPRGIPVRWYHALQDVPRHLSCFFAHEFFDALPVHQLQKTPKGWREVLVDVDLTARPRQFRFVLSHSETPACRLYIKQDGEHRNSLEVSPIAGSIMQQLAERLYQDGGLALVMDYGHDGTRSNTFRAFRRHQLHDPLVAPGSADLTADVDFSYLRSCAGDSITLGPVTQATFLLGLGIRTRLQMLLGSCPPEQHNQLLSGYRMMIDPDKMGSRFLVFAMFPSVLQDHLAKFPVAGFHQI